MLDAHKGPIEPFHLSIGVPQEEFRQLIERVYLLGASDIKIQSGDFIWADINRRWQPVTSRRLEPHEVQRALTLLVDQSALGLVNGGEPVDDRVDLSMDARTVREFRLNATGSMVAGIRDGMTITLRAIPSDIPSLERLGIEQEIIDNFFPRYGLILVVGTTGSGKSTLLASSIRHRLVHRRHDPVAIGTYEDPIEYGLKGLAQGSMPEPTQVAIGPGRHIRDWERVGPNAMRRRLDVIWMGEIRDIESARTGLELARTGHSVMATLHVDTPAEAFDRLIKFFPKEVQESEAYAILSQIRMIVAQKLARTTDGGKMAFRSWVVMDRATKDRLLDHDYSKWSRVIRDIIQERGSSFEECAFRALSQGRITLETFREVAGMTPVEAHHYLQEKNFDVSTLG
ncbi:MAG: ATPase, T2SS/T4P/T4SS family [Gammaproteobacteria bacterium]|nr:ATPase, T2SS/T4P/T4SS family [Gammaproteobacteria bacterium]